LETKKRYLIAVLALMLGGAACRGKHSVVAVQNEEYTTPRMASTVRANDAKLGLQLLSGFFPIEGSAWRWTAGKFSVMLRTPDGAAQRGGTVSFDFTIPDVVIQHSKDITLTASINGMMLKSAEYKAAGAETFTADVPTSMLTADSVKVDFALDKTLPPSVDKRELGVIATSVGISSK
jgi:hypothetical protein